HLPHQLLFGAEAAVEGGGGDPRGACDVLEAGVDAALREDLLGRFQQPAAVGLGVPAQRGHRRSSVVSGPTLSSLSSAATAVTTDRASSSARTPATLPRNLPSTSAAV